MHEKLLLILGIKPKNVSHLEAATFPLAAGTAWEMLSRSVRLPGLLEDFHHLESMI
jgi:NADPH:quinone reductase-like Zn-dependent oxidoreductase